MPTIINDVLAALDEANADVPNDDYITLDELREYVGRALTEYHRLLMMHQEQMAARSTR